MRSERRREIDLYRKYASDDDFKRGMHAVLMRMMEHMMRGGGNSTPAA